jgi:hypothetical protein
MSENIIRLDAESDDNGYGFDLIADHIISVTANVCGQKAVYR